MDDSTPQPQLSNQSPSEETVLSDNQAAPLPTVENAAALVPDQVPAQPSPRVPAAELLKLLLEQNSLEIILPPVTTRSIEDGSLIIDLPKSISVKYGDE